MAGRVVAEAESIAANLIERGREAVVADDAGTLFDTGAV
jgi:hypothetical protein